MLSNEHDTLECIFETIFDDVEDKNVFAFDLTVEFCFANGNHALHLKKTKYVNVTYFDIFFAMENQGIVFSSPADLRVCLSKSVLTLF